VFDCWDVTLQVTLPLVSTQWFANRSSRTCFSNWNWFGVAVFEYGHGLQAAAPKAMHTAMMARAIFFVPGSLPQL
jgi:hypothetical protein